MNTEQLRAEFEAHFSRPPFEWEFHRYGEDSAWPGNYQLYEHQCAWEAYQVGRAALQSQDREDAERYRAWRKAVAAQNINFMRIACNGLPDWDEGPVDESRVDAAIDHARRVEGDGDAI